ncbi:hypothetical protein, partial [Pseudomonas sp. SWI36]|uniref:hypothetical protein n=1 Tax=Pseudomonas sp. SWI36 TaxID=2083052 RepID=UPI0021148E64
KGGSIASLLASVVTGQAQLPYRQIGDTVMPCLPNTDFATSTASSQGKGIIYHPTFTLRAVGWMW